VVCALQKCFRHIITLCQYPHPYGNIISWLLHDFLLSNLHCRSLLSHMCASHSFICRGSLQLISQLFIRCMPAILLFVMSVIDLLCVFSLYIAFAFLCLSVFYLVKYKNCASAVSHCSNIKP